MIIDKKNKSWILASVAIFVLATIIYVPYSRRLNGPSGGSFWGLTFGIVGFAMMWAVMALALRKKLRTARVGRAYHWMQAHVWLGLLAYPIILYHAGFHWGAYGTLTQLIMWLFTFVVGSGIFGIAVQNVVPTRMFREVQMETVYDQIDKIVGMIRSDADNRISNLQETAAQAETFEIDFIPAGSAAALGLGNEGGTTALVAATRTQALAPGVRPLKDFYHVHVRPFLHDQPTPENKLSNTAKSELVFEQMRRLLPPTLHEILDDLQAAVEERRQLARQKSLHWWLHSWLIVHVPISYALMILSIFHAFYALRYAS